MTIKTAHLIPLSDTTLDQAERVRRAEDPNDFQQSVLSEKEFMSIHIPPRSQILKGLIVEKTITIMNGYRGGGKSWLVDSMANEVSWGGQLGPWKVEQALNTMIIDGEMPMSLIQERMSKLNKGRKIGDKKAELYIYPESYAYRIGLNRANILDSVWRERIHDEIERLDIGFLVLDNLSSLAPGVDENEKMPFDAVSRWLLELRFDGVTIVMTHHTGKGGEQRGTSAHEDHVDTAIVLNKPRGYAQDDGCMFTCVATKDRAFIIKGKSTTLKLEDDKVGGARFIVIDESNSSKGETVKMMPDMTYKEAKEKGISTRTYYRIKKGGKE